MQDSLGGNAKTMMVVNVSPVDYNKDETMNSLMYATSCKKITNQAKNNVESEQVARLKQTVAQLEARLAQALSLDPSKNTSETNKQASATTKSKWPPQPTRTPAALRATEITRTDVSPPPRRLSNARCRVSLPPSRSDLTTYEEEAYAEKSGPV